MATGIGGQNRMKEYPATCIHTWRDRAAAPMAARCIRFQLSNGGVSLAGNLLLMRLLVEGQHVPVLAANGVAIVICSLVNFCVGDRWVFAETRA
ncbi:MAG: GtrA family protein [Acidobacteriota bacterium]